MATIRGNPRRIPRSYVNGGIMDAQFQCVECGCTFYQSLDSEGLYVKRCPRCPSVYVLCLNLEEALKELEMNNSNGGIAN